MGAEDQIMLSSVYATIILWCLSWLPDIATRPWRIMGDNRLEIWQQDFLLKQDT